MQDAEPRLAIDSSLWRKRLYEPASDINLFMYGEDGSEENWFIMMSVKTKRSQRLLLPEERQPGSD